MSVKKGKLYNMIIREYEKNDEYEWLKCRLLSFYRTSYCDDVIHQKPKYKNKCIDLVAVNDNTIVGFMEVEIEEHKKDICYLSGELGGVIWNIGVLEEYRNKGIATKLLDEAVIRAKKYNIKRFEVWTQDDLIANNWYVNRGFNFRESYLNVYASSKECIENNLISEKIGNIYGIRNFNFEAPIQRKQEIMKKYSKYYEVKLYELNWKL